METRQITGNGQSAAFRTDGVSNLALHCSGTFSGANCTFEGTVDGASWFGIEAVRSNGNTIETTTGVLGAAPAYSWDVECGGYERVRVRATAFTSGTQVWAASGYNGGLASAPAMPSLTVGTLPALPAGTNAIGDVGVQARANATGAASVRHVVAAASTNATSVKASAGRVLGYTFGNATASWRYVKLHNVATAPTPGAAVAMTIPVPPNGITSASIPAGIGFATGIGLSIVTGSADADATAVAAGDVSGHLVFA